MADTCQHGIDIDSPGDVLVGEDGTTSCCGAYSTIFTDDGSEYRKCCYRTVTGYIGTAVFDLPTTIVLPNDPSDDNS